MNELEKTPEVNPNMSIFPRWLRLNYVALNGLSGAIGFTAGMLSGNVAITLAGLQATVEAKLADAQMKDAHHNNPVSEKRRKRIYTSITSLSLIGAGVAVANTAGAFEANAEVPFTNIIGLGATAVGLTSGLFAAGVIAKRLNTKYGKVFHRKNHKKLNVSENSHSQEAIEPPPIDGVNVNPKTQAEKDAIKHIITKDLVISSLAAASGIARLWQVHKYGEDGAGTIESLLGFVTAVYGAYLFRPTKRNLAHDELPTDYNETPQGD